MPTPWSHHSLPTDAQFTLKLRSQAIVFLLRLFSPMERHRSERDIACCDPWVACAP